MKKLFFLFSITMVTTGVVFASVDSNDLTSLKVLEQQGYSIPALQMVDTAKSKNSYDNDVKYVRVYKKKKSVYQALKNYFDPIQDDGEFGEHKIEFSNTWNGDTPDRYVTPLKPKKNIESL